MNPHETGQRAGRLPGSAEEPVGTRPNAAEFGSDVVAETLSALDIPYIALNPGASFRGLHDSLVNFLGNRRPQMLLCLHEEHAVAIAQGYAKVTGRPMAVALHSNVGLMHASMAIFNAWCDRMPILILGATGPVDAARRRPWIDWIHTARDQGALVRGFTKWDDQPASPAAAREALLRAAWIATTAPMGPVYVNLDAGLQEAPLSAPLTPLDAARFMPPVQSAAPEHLIADAARRLAGATSPVILAGRGSRGMAAWTTRVRLAEALGARVVTDLKTGAAFPTDHPLHISAPSMVAPNTEAFAAIRSADVILSLDWVDLAGTLQSAHDGGWPRGKIIQASIDHQVHNGWSMDHQALPPVDLLLAADPDQVATLLVSALDSLAKPPGPHPTASATTASATVAPGGPLGVEDLGIEDLGIEDLARALRRAVGSRDVSLAHLPLSWSGAWWPLRHPLDYLGSDGGAGIGAGPAIGVGAALALAGSGRLVISICGDGDFLMGATALWTAVHYRLPLLVVVANNRSFYNDEMHQERMARMRGRPIENKWIGQRIADPDIDLAGLARGQGARGFGPIEEAADLDVALAAALAAVDEGAVAVVDARVAPGYGAAPGGRGGVK
jgi:thiamine pyrophosphate-dependent acetolactate synthase large subunit-like protein